MDMGCLYAHYIGRGESESTGHWSFSPRLREGFDGGSLTAVQLKSTCLPIRHLIFYLF